MLLLENAKLVLLPKASRTWFAPCGIYSAAPEVISFRTQPVLELEAERQTMKTSPSVSPLGRNGKVSTEVDPLKRITGQPFIALETT